MEKRSSKSRGRQAPKRQSSFVTLCLLTLYTLLSSYLIFLVLTYNFLNVRSINLMVIAALVLIFLIGLWLLIRRQAKFFNQMLLLAASLVVGAGVFFARSAIDFANRLNYTASFSQMDLSVVVQKDSPLTSIEQVNTILGPSNDSTNVQDLLEHLASQKSLSPTLEEVDSYQTAYEEMLEDGNKAMVMNSAYLSLLESIDPDFSDKVKTLYEAKVEKAVTLQPVQEKKDQPSDSFNIYISGIDSHGPISAVSRSDVNIIMTVNRKTKKILLTTTPRDAYLPIAGGGNNQPDKLTHAGIYGINASIETLENLYDIDIDYYARLNFTSFVKLIDTVGGVEVHNDQEFVSHIGGIHFPVGPVHLDSEKALAFVRERYSLKDGDNDRGKNQEKVVAALIDKLGTVRSVALYRELIDGLGEAVQTDMPLPLLMDLANQQLEEGTKYEVVSQALEGTGSTGQLPSYAMPNARLYMVSVDDASLAQVKSAMQATLEGQ